MQKAIGSCCASTGTERGRPSLRSRDPPGSNGAAATWVTCSNASGYRLSKGSAGDACEVRQVRPRLRTVVAVPATKNTASTTIAIRRSGALGGRLART